MARCSSVRVGRVAVGLGLVLALVAAPAFGQITDSDQDGINDSLDQCPGTSYGDLVTPQGCSVCSCDAAWVSHQAYVDCVTAEANRRYLLKLITKTQKSKIITAAKNSTCGYIPAKTRCCTWRKLRTGSMGVCSLTAPADCSYFVLRRWAEDRGTGSCTYNPCTW